MNEMITTNKNKALAAIHKIGRAADQSAAAAQHSARSPQQTTKTE